MIMATLAVVFEYLDHPAFTNTPVIALTHHAAQFIPQSGQAFNAIFNIIQMMPRNRICLMTGRIGRLGHGQQFTDIIDFKAEITRMTDKRQPLDILRAIFPPLAFGALRLADQPDLLIKTDGRHLNAAAFSNLTDRIALFIHFCACSYSH